MTIRPLRPIRSGRQHRSVRSGGGRSVGSVLPDRLLAGLCDDASLFPPSQLPMDQAVVAHLTHLRSPYAGMVGPFIVAVHDLDLLAETLRGCAADLPHGGMAVSVTAPSGSVCRAISATDAMPTVRLAAVEVAPPTGRATEAVAQLQTLLAERPAAAYLELPRDERRDGVIAALAGTSIRAKIRTGGVMAALYPSVEELADTLLALARAGVRFKATAGLHHAVRNTDPATGFDQHGFLNVMLATAAALSGAEAGEVVGLLSERDPQVVARAVRGLSAAAAVRERFLSFGTCSIHDPVSELVALGLLPADRMPAGRPALVAAADGGS